jgi:hypothetical protein
MLIQTRMSARALATLLGVDTVLRRASQVTRAYRSRARLWLPQLSAHLDPRNNVRAVITGPAGLRLVLGANIVTDAGDVYYAQKMVGEAVTNTFNRMALGTGKTAAWAKGSLYGNLTGAIAGSILALDAAYPKRNDGDAANSGKGVNVATWKRTYTDADFTSGVAITDGVLTITGPVAGSPILAGWTFAQTFTLQANEQVVVYVNHSTTGQ